MILFYLFIVCLFFQTLLHALNLLSNTSSKIVGSYDGSFVGSIEGRLVGLSVGLVGEADGA
jgi:hypothetical protein